MWNQSKQCGKSKLLSKTERKHIYTAPGVRKRGRVSLSRVLFDKWLADRKCGARFRGQSVSSILSVELPQEDFDSKSWYNNKGVKNLWNKKWNVSLVQEDCFRIFSSFYGSCSAVVNVSRFDEFGVFWWARSWAQFNGQSRLWQLIFR